MAVKKTNISASDVSNLNQGRAVAGLVLGIISIVTSWIPIIGQVIGIIAVVISFKAKKAIEQQPTVYGGRGMALAGFITGIVGLSLSAIYILYWILISVVLIGALSSVPR